MAKFSLPEFDLEKLKARGRAVASFVEEHRRPVAVGGGALLLLLFALLLLMASGGRRSPSEEERPGGGEIRTLVPPEEAFLPNERERLLELEEERYRQPRTPWEEELVDEFWNPVRETAIEALMEAGADEVEGIFEGIE